MGFLLPDNTVGRRVWKRALHDANILCRSGFYTRRNPYKSFFNSIASFR